MGCCGDKKACGGPGASYFDGMIDRCLEYAEAAHKQGRPIVGICCEFTPRELIMAAGAVPVCLCGGSAEMIAAAEEELPANLCPLIKSTYGYLVTGANPFLEMADLVVAETTCDGKKKMYERMAEHVAMHVLELPVRPDAPDALRRWRGELVRLRDALEGRYGVTISDDALWAQIRNMNRERRLRRELAGLMVSDPPAMTGRELLTMKSSISCMPSDFEQYAVALEDYRVAGPRAELAGRPRVLMTGVPIPDGAERVLDIVEGAGAVVVAMENCTGLKPIIEDVDESAADPLTALALKYLHLPCSVMTPNTRRFEMLEDLIERYRPDAIIELIWQACLTYDVESRLVRRLAQRKGLGYLRIETDYSPSDSARIATRVEALLETSGRRAPRK